MSGRALRLALCALGTKTEQWIRILLSRSQFAGASVQAIPQGPFEHCELALADFDSADSRAAQEDAARLNPGMRTIWISTDGDLGPSDHRIARRALMFRLTSILAELTTSTASPAIPTSSPAASFATASSTPDGHGVEATSLEPTERSLFALVVDDSLTVRVQLSAFLERIGLRTSQASTAEEAEGELRRRPFDIIFLDVVMPGRDGYAFCRELRRNPSTTGLIIVMLTSRSAPFDRARGALAGCDLYLTKPVQMTEVFQAVDRAVMKALNEDRAAAHARGYKPQSA